MKTKHLMSGKNVVALKILENDVMNTDPVEVAKLLAEYGAVVFKNVITPVKNIPNTVNLILSTFVITFLFLI